ncbi:hypothetical protein DFJ73DRAFT_762531 [Zopfochytrium polystomum]|nr:hypothetical protein DFJ73DRAFT_762531 [Zopfochytrium polystomum]
MGHYLSKTGSRSDSSHYSGILETLLITPYFKELSGDTKLANELHHHAVFGGVTDARQALQAAVSKSFAAISGESAELARQIIAIHQQAAANQCIIKTKIEVKHFPGQDLREDLHIPAKNQFDPSGYHLLEFFEDVPHLTCKRLVWRFLDGGGFADLNPQAWREETKADSSVLPESWWKRDAMDVEQGTLFWSPAVLAVLQSLGYEWEADFAPMVGKFYEPFDRQGLSNHQFQAWLLTHKSANGSTYIDRTTEKKLFSWNNPSEILEEDIRQKLKQKQRSMQIDPSVMPTPTPQTLCKTKAKAMQLVLVPVREATDTPDGNNMQ